VTPKHLDGRFAGESPALRRSFRAGTRSASARFAVIAEGDRWSVSGMCGRIWTLRRHYPRIEGADDFLAWDDPNTVRVLTHWTERDGPRQSALVSEARIKPVDRQAGMGLRALWVVVRHLERLIGSEVLRAAVRDAERS
jgi:hypothetical protein